MEEYKGFKVPDRDKPVSASGDAEDYCEEAIYNCGGVVCSECLFVKNTAAFQEWKEKQKKG